jgi:5'-3' exonuclease
MKNYDPLKYFPHSTNRLVIVDWASLSYHQWHGINTKLKHSYMTQRPVNDWNDKDDWSNYSDEPVFERTQENELAMWRTSMINRMMRYVKLFNPIDMIFALEGIEVWRNDVVKEYYGENCTVFYDKHAYYLRYDNFLYKVTNRDTGIFAEKKDFVKDAAILDNPSKLLKDMPERVQRMMWDAYLPNGTAPLLPKYKGKRLKQQWDFVTEKKYWREYKEEFAKDISSVFRAKTVRRMDAEGDDVIYVACNYLKDKYDSIILITGDSDMNQLLTIPNLKIYNHRHDQIVECEHPEDYLEIKILQGDSSDNINGMALPNKKTQLGEKGAEKLFESTNNIYAQAQADGWDKQYRRNQTLIDLSYIPTTIQRNICNLIDDAKSELCELEYIYSLDTTKKTIDELINMKNMGMYSMLDKGYAEENPDIFNPEQFEQQEAAEKMAATSTKREFGDMKDVFDDPLNGEDIF